MDTITKMGSHIILDFFGITSIDLNDYDSLNKVLTSCIVSCGATIEAQNYKQFIPQGLSILYLLSESHFSIHTWPENKSCTIDFYHCGETAFERLSKAEEILCDQFGWENCTSSILIERGGTRQALLNRTQEHTTLFKGFQQLFRERSSFNDIRIFQNLNKDKFLSLNGNLRLKEVSSGKNDEEERLIQYFSKHFFSGKSGDFENVLMIGAGELSAGVYLLERFPQVKKITIVEKDARLLEAYSKFKVYERFNDLLKQGKFEVRFESPESFVVNKAAEGFQYDGVIIDLLEGESSSLLKKEAFENVAKITKTGASLIQNVKEDRFKKRWEELIKSVGFSDVTFFSSKHPELTYLPLGSGKKS